MDLQRCLKILELDCAGSLQEAKRAYKDLVRVWHPDRFHKSPRLKDKAEKKLREINLAYSYLQRYLESNPARAGSTPEIDRSNSPSGIHADLDADTSGSCRTADHTRRPQAKINPYGAHHSSPAVKSVPQRTSSIGRYVLLAALCVLMAISALVVYLLLNADEIASKTRGIASEAMEKIVDKLEKSDSIQKTDSPVQQLIEKLDRPTTSKDPEKKFEIHLNSGSIIMTEMWWEENEMIVYKVDGGSMGIERSSVRKIVKRK